MKLSDKAYDILKWLVLIVIPALTTFYCVIDRLFGWGYAEIVATISAALCTCIGAIVGISTAQYNKDFNDDPSDFGGTD
jgi:hypothetical protein